jgi:hypothetical protein
MVSCIYRAPDLNHWRVLDGDQYQRVPDVPDKYSEIREGAMISRRGLLACGSGVAASGFLSPARALAATIKTYDDAVRSTWAPLGVDGGLRELIRYATLAANSHNTQPWKFAAGERRITIAPDLARRCPADAPPSTRTTTISLSASDAQRRTSSMRLPQPA